MSTYSLNVEVVGQGVKLVQPKGGVESREFFYKFEVQCSFCRRNQVASVCFGGEMKGFKKFKCVGCHTKCSVELIPGYGRAISGVEGHRGQLPVKLVNLKCKQVTPQRFVPGANWEYKVNLSDDKFEDFDFNENEKYLSPDGTVVVDLVESTFVLI